MMVDGSLISILPYISYTSKSGFVIAKGRRQRAEGSKGRD